MPLYEYRCVECEHEFETLVSVGRADEVTCPACGTGEVHRLLSLFSAPRGGGAASAWTASGPAAGGDGASTPAGCCGGACGNC